MSEYEQINEGDEANPEFDEMEDETLPQSLHTTLEELREIQRFLSDQRASLQKRFQPTQKESKRKKKKKSQLDDNDDETSPELLADDWMLYDIRGGARIFHKPATLLPNFPKGSKFRISTGLIYSAELSQVAELVSDLNYDVRRLWDPLLVDCCKVRDLKANCTLAKFHYSPFSWWIWPREMSILQTKWQDPENGSFFVAQHSTDAEVGPQAVTPAGPLHSDFAGGFIVEKVESVEGLEAVQITYVYEWNLKGWTGLAPLEWITSLLCKKAEAIHGLKALLDNQVDPLKAIRLKMEKVHPSRAHQGQQSQESNGTQNAAAFETHNSVAQNPLKEEAAESDEEEDDEDDEEDFVIPPIEAMPTEYQSLMDDTVNKLLALEKDKKWQIIGVEEGVEISKKETTPPINRGRGRIKAPFYAVQRLFRQLERRREWDEFLDVQTSLEDVNEETKVLRLKYKGVFPTSPRDLVTLSHGRRLAYNKWIVCAKSIQHPQCPPVSSHVRATCIIAGYIFTSPMNNLNVVDVTYLVQTDLNGNIPTYIQNMVAKKQPLSIRRIANVVEKEDMTEPRALVKMDEEALKQRLQQKAQRLQQRRDKKRSASRGTPPEGRPDSQSPQTMLPEEIGSSTPSSSALQNKEEISKEGPQPSSAGKRVSQSLPVTPVNRVRAAPTSTPSPFKKE